MKQDGKKEVFCSSGKKKPPLNRKSASASPFLQKGIEAFLLLNLLAYSHTKPCTLLATYN